MSFFNVLASFTTSFYKLAQS